MRARIAWLTLVCLLSLAGCGEQDVAPTKTQVTLRVQGLEAALFESASSLRITLFRKDDSWVNTDSLQLSKKQLRFPLDIPIIPRSANALSAPFEAVIDVFAGDVRLAQTRVVSNYVVNSLRMLEVWLHACPDQPALCVDDACHGPACASCDLGGACTPVGLTDATTLPLFNPSETPTVKAPATVGPPASDSGSDAMEMDAGAPIDPNACMPGCVGGSSCVLGSSGPICSCPRGYVLQDGSCQDVDECKAGNGGCSINATCHNTPCARTCTCASGYTDTRGDGSECLEPSIPNCPACPSPGYCMRTATTATCMCPAGWTLDASGCVAPVGCASVKCGAHSSCAVSGSATSCTCDPGYTQSGAECVPIDECQTGTHTCGVGTCSAGAVVGYSCTCPMGYQATSDMFPSCVPIDECKQATDPCGANGTCSAGAGVGYACTCKQGYVSNGQTFTSCVAEDECMTGTHGCAPGGTCSNGAGAGYQCTCMQGYSNTGGSFPKCTAIDECATATHGCSPGGTCSNGSGVGYTCTCNQGYTSSGGSFPKCNAVDECATGTHWCAPAAGSCTGGAAAGYDCTCPAGFTDSGGSFPQCYRSGSVTASYTSGVTFDFPGGTTTSCCTNGEFYISDNDVKFWANNVMQRGVVRVDTASTTPLLQVPVPTSGYTRFGVAIAVGGTYVSYAQEGEGSYYVIFRVTSFSSSTIALDFVYVYRP